LYYFFFKNVAFKEERMLALLPFIRSNHYFGLASIDLHPHYSTKMLIHTVNASVCIPKLSQKKVLILDNNVMFYAYEQFTSIFLLAQYHFPD